MKIALVLALFSTVALLSPAGVDEERKAVERAVADYLEGLYDANPELIERSVHTDLTKIGFYRQGDKQEYAGPLRMTYEELHALAAKWNADGSRVDESSPREIEILDVLDTTASAKLTAAWGIDYFHLAKYDDKWKIVNVMWQSHPPVIEGAYAK